MKDLYQNRTPVIRILFGVFALLLLIRLFTIQVTNKQYKTLANDNVVKESTVYPTRGLIYDRKGNLLVYNEALFDIMVVPRQVKNIDTAKLCDLLDISMEQYKTQISKARKYSYFKESVFLKQVDQATYLKFHEHLYRFPGFYGQVRTIRHYPFQSAAHVLGDVGEVNQRDIDESEYYVLGDYIGKSGIEWSHEQELRGEKGKRYKLVDVHNREQGDFSSGSLNKHPETGANIITTLDIDLQLYGERLMQNKMGSIVAIEPATGEVLAMVSSPNFDPNLLCGRTRGDNFNALKRDTLKPLFNRPIMAQYPPGSTFKAFVALSALQDGAIQENFYYRCGGSYTIPGYVLKCSHGHKSARNVQEALKHSCNPYFWQTFRNNIDLSRFEKVQDAYQNWYDNMASLGVGVNLGVDLPGEKIGNLPGSDYYDRMYGTRGWRSPTILSLGIGQGEILMTPLQLANAYAAIANRGYYVKPHLVRAFQDDDGRMNEAQAYYRDSVLRKYHTRIDRKHFDPVVEGLHMVVESGTGIRSRMRDIEMCGKTGTAQNPHGEDHSIFAAFAPKDDPKIAIAVIVENAGGGSRYAAPIASLMIEQYLNDSIADYRSFLEQGILEADLIPGNVE